LTQFIALVQFLFSLSVSVRVLSLAIVPLLFVYHDHVQNSDHQDFGSALEAGNYRSATNFLEY
jgi:hypothetical protein